MTAQNHQLTAARGFGLAHSLKCAKCFFFSNTYSIRICEENILRRWCEMSSSKVMYCLQLVNVCKSLMLRYSPFLPPVRLHLCRNGVKAYVGRKPTYTVHLERGWTKSSPNHQAAWHNTPFPLLTCSPQFSFNIFHTDLFYRLQRETIPHMHVTESVRHTHTLPWLLPNFFLGTYASIRFHFLCCVTTKHKKDMSLDSWAEKSAFGFRSYNKACLMLPCFIYSIHSLKTWVGILNIVIVLVLVVSQ